MIHLAGPPVEIGDYVVQRCVICGFPFDDGTKDGHGRGQFLEGGLYEFLEADDDGRRSQRLVGQVTPPYEFPAMDALPETLCVRQRRPDQTDTVSS